MSTRKQDDDRNQPSLSLPRAEIVGAFGVAAAMLFGIIFSVSSAVMSPPRDVRLSVQEHHKPSAREGLALESSSNRTLR